MVNEAGYTKRSLGVIFSLLVSTTAFISVLPRTILEIVRKVRRLRRLASV
jgi:hypothetical protein